MNQKVITISGEQPELGENPSSCAPFRDLYPKLFAPLQVETFDQVRSGQSLALVAPTSSGKTMAIAAPLFESRRKAVFVYPFRALVLDQTNQLIRYAKPFGLIANDFAQVMGGTPKDELARAISKDYILMTPDKLVALFEGGREAKGAALTILNNYVFVFDEVHSYNSLMRESLKYFIRSVKYWREDGRGKTMAFYFLSATFPGELWGMLEQELGMSAANQINGISNTGDVSLVLRPNKDDHKEIAREMSEMMMTENVVGIFNTALKAWRVAESLWGRDLAKQRLFVGQDKMSELERVRNFNRFVDEPESGGLCGSPAIEAGVDFGAANLVIEETYTDSFLQRFGRAARSRQNANVLCYSSTLYDAQQKGSLQSSYSRGEFLELIRKMLPTREPSKLFTGLAAFPYFKFWDGPEFIDAQVLSLCRKLQDKGVDNLLAFRGFTPYTHYQTGESIGYRALFKKALRMDKNEVVGSPGLERYFFTKNRMPINATLRQIGYPEKVDEYTTVFLAQIAFDGFGTHWTIMEYKTPGYEQLHPGEQDDNICLRGFSNGEVGRVSENVRNGILKFYDVDA